MITYKITLLFSMHWLDLQIAWCPLIYVFCLLHWLEGCYDIKLYFIGPRSCVSEELLVEKSKECFYVTFYYLKTTCIFPTIKIRVLTVGLNTPACSHVISTSLPYRAYLRTSAEPWSGEIFRQLETRAPKIEMQSVFKRLKLQAFLLEWTSQFGKWHKSRLWLSQVCSQTDSF